MEEGEYYPQAIPQQIDSRSLLATATDPAKIIEELRHRLRGETWIPVENKWEKNPDAEPVINEHGATELFNAIFVRVNQNTIFSNLEDREVRNLIIHLGDDLMYLLADNFEKWEVKDEEALNLIFANVLDIVFLALKRGYAQGERKFLSKVVSQQENIIHQPTQRKASLLGGFFNKNKE